MRFSLILPIFYFFLICCYTVMIIVQNVDMTHHTMTTKYSQIAQHVRQKRTCPSAKSRVLARYYDVRASLCKLWAQHCKRASKTLKTSKKSADIHFRKSGRCFKFPVYRDESECYRILPIVSRPQYPEVSILRFKVSPNEALLTTPCYY